MIIVTQVFQTKITKKGNKGPTKEDIVKRSEQSNVKEGSVLR